MVESETAGTYNATGPETPLSMEAFLDTCKETVGSSSEFVWVDEKFLIGHEEKGWSDLPLWIPDSFNMDGFLAVDIQKALAAGLKFRPLEETVLDTFAWEKTRAVSEKQAGLQPEKEQAVLVDWKKKGL